VPEELAYLFSRAGAGHRICPSISTGLACGRVGDPVLLRALQEVIERDAVIGAWWGSCLLEEWEPGQVLRTLDPDLPRRLLRPNLRYRFYRVAGPFSAHVTIVTVEGEDREGFCFSAGSACRGTRQAAWLKAILEAVHGRHYVRYLLKKGSAERRRGEVHAPADFREHAVYYSLWPQDLDRTVLHCAVSVSSDAGENSREDVPALIERLGPNRPVLFRNMTPPGIAAGQLDWYVLKVLVPGLQPLHGNHRLPHLGGPLWTPRGLLEWRRMLPHPFP
jgi:ribosomal protein S12 methylthiotransferase accessory factor